MDITKIFNENKNLILTTLAIVVVAALGLGLWQRQVESTNVAATNLLYESQLQARGLAEQKKLDDAIAAFKPVLEKFPNSRAAYEANLQIGDLLMDAGKPSDAAEKYEAAVKLASDSFAKILAKYSVGMAWEGAGQLDKAVAAYEESMQVKGVDFLAPEVLMAQARCYEGLKQNQRAIEIYKQVQDKFASRTYYSGAAAAYEKQLKAANI